MPHATRPLVDNDRYLNRVATGCRRWLVGLAVTCLLATPFPATAQQLTKPHDFSAGSPASAAEVNENFDVLFGRINSLADELQQARLELAILNAALAAAGGDDDSGEEPTGTINMGTSPYGMSYVMPIPAFSVVNCNNAICSPPALTGGLFYRSGVGLFPQGCELESCTDGEIIADRCYGNYCFRYTDPPAEGPWYADVCRWFYVHENELAIDPNEICQGGPGFRTALEAALIPCISPSNGIRATEGACPREARLSLVLPLDHNLEGFLFVHEGQRLVSSRYVERMSRWPSDWIVPCPLNGGDCLRVWDGFMDPGFIDVGLHVFSVLTTYGYEWDLVVDVPDDGTHLVCDLLSGECAAAGLVGASGDVRANLTWSGTADLDLAVTDPCGQKIDFVSTQATCQGFVGELDVDSLIGGSENIVWTAGAPNGSYDVEVNYYGGSGPVSYTLTLFTGGAQQSYNGVLNAPGNKTNYPLTY